MPVFTRKDDGRVLSANEGSALEEVLRTDPEWVETEPKKAAAKKVAAEK